MPNPDTPKPKCFLCLPRSSGRGDVLTAVKEAAVSAGFDLRSQFDLRPPEFGSSFTELIKAELIEADCVVADVTDLSSTIAAEIGLAEGMGKPVLIISQQSKEKRKDERPSSFLSDFPILAYDPSAYGLHALSEEIAHVLQNFRDSPRRGLAPTNKVPAFFVDWDRLDKPEAENLCRELMVQMGFRRLDWFKHSPEIDIVAELPKKDPDGFEYRELWLVTMGRNAPIEMVFDMATHEPEMFWDRFIRRSERPDRIADYRQDVPLTLLFITFEENSKLNKYMDSPEIFHKMRRRYTTSLRLRHWDRSYLTSLVQQFPQLGYKYFSDEARVRSKSRKTYEELYTETVRLNERLAATNKALEDEKNARVRAERDAVWKDISFTAAHRIGNPIFAIETNLDPLLKRIKEGNSSEAVEVVDDIRASVGKAKDIVEQFKSLTKAQEIHPEPCKLSPILSASCRPLRDTEVKMSINCAEDVTVLADFERLSEVFDELTANSVKWLDPANGQITIRATSPFTGPLPASVDSSKKYALVHFQDNGPGVAIENKERIFEAFFTTDDQGTGLGLALVRRVIEGHGGVIIESGVPGKGADFEIYLPLPEQSAAPSKKKAKRIKK